MLIYIIILFIYLLSSPPANIDLKLMLCFCRFCVHMIQRYIDCLLQGQDSIYINLQNIFLVVHVHLLAFFKKVLIDILLFSHEGISCISTGIVQSTMEVCTMELGVQNVQG